MRTRLLVIVGIIVVVALGVLAIFRIGAKDTFLNKQKPAVSRKGIQNQAQQQETEGNLLEAKSLYEKLVTNFPNSNQIGGWQQKVWDLNIRVLFSREIVPGSVIYEIKSGDSLGKISTKFNTTIELLKVSNGLLNDTIIAGRKLRVWTKPFNIVVDKSQNILFLKVDDEVIKTYIVATGVKNSTPVGTFKIINKLVDPPWFKDGSEVPSESPDNILGSRWMGFELKGYGIHGTTKEESLGQQVTEGCVRMRNSDVEELFAIVPSGTEVIIID